VPTAMVEDIALIGPAEKVRDDLEGLARFARHHHVVNGTCTLRTMAELVLG